MWVEIICGLIFYRLIRRFFYDDDILEVEASDSSALFSVANRYLLKVETSNFSMFGLLISATLRRQNEIILFSM